MCVGFWCFYVYDCRCVETTVEMLLCECVFVWGGGGDSVAKRCLLSVSQWQTVSMEVCTHTHLRLPQLTPARNRERERKEREGEERARPEREGTRQQRRERRRRKMGNKAFSHSILHHPILPIVIRWTF